MCMSSKMATAKSYVKDDSGATFIPATQRPDGTWRKARRVKDGYVPQEEQPLYESKGKQWAKNQPTLPPGLHPDDAARALSRQKQEIGISRITTSTLCGSDGVNSPSQVNMTPNNCHPVSKAAKKNAKRKEKKKQKQTQDNDTSLDGLSNSLHDVDISPKMVESNKLNNSNKLNASNSSTTDPAKRLKNLKKKLRDIEVLKEKIESGQLVNPEKDQLEKIARQKEIEEAIDAMELLLDEV